MKTIEMVQRTCRFCGAGFAVTPKIIAIGKGGFCSRPCAYRQQSQDSRNPAVLAKRFAAYVNVNGPVPAHLPDLGQCHIWTGPVDDHGYGKMGFAGREEKAHRLAFYLAEDRWPVPCGLHRCDNPPCVRRSHLFEGTKKQNTADMIAKGRARQGALRYGADHWSHHKPESIARGDRSGARLHPERVVRGDNHPIRQHPEIVRGENNGNAKLTEADVLVIRSERESGVKLKVLAFRFSVTEALISAVAHRRAWGHV